MLPPCICIHLLCCMEQAKIWDTYVKKNRNTASIIDQFKKDTIHVTWGFSCEICISSSGHLLIVTATVTINVSYMITAVFRIIGYFQVCLIREDAVCQIYQSRNPWKLNSLHPNINMHILHTVVYTFSNHVLARRICWTIKRIFSWWSFPLFSCLIQGWYWKEKLDASLSQRLKVK